MKIFKIALGVGLSGFFLWLAFRNVDLARAWIEMGSLSLDYVLLYVALLVFIQFARVLRWEILIRPFVQVNTATLLRVGNLGFMFNLLLPLRLGELARPYLLKRETGARLTAGLASVVVERALDGLLVCGLFFWAVSSLPAQYRISTRLHVAAFVALGIFSGALVAMVLALLTNGLSQRLVRRLLGPIWPRLAERLAGMLDAFVSGLRSLPDARSVVAFAAWTLAYWGANALSLWVVMRGFGWDLPVSAGFLVLSVLVIGIMIPAGPGLLGTFQAALIAGLGVFGVEDSAAAAYGFVVYPLNVLVPVAFGLPYLFGAGTPRLGEMIQTSE